MMSILFLLVGLGLILSGANFLTDGAAALAKRFNISSLVIGLTIVAFGTSAPELTVSIVSAINGSAELSIGNVVGSNIFNILMIVGVTAVVAPITITKGTLTKEIPLAILSCVVVLICANDVFLETGAENILNRADGLLMLCFFAIFLGYTFAIAHAFPMIDECKDCRNSSVLCFVRETPTIKNLSGRSFLSNSSNNEGMSFRWVKSPDAPKIIRIWLSGILFISKFFVCFYRE